MLPIIGCIILITLFAGMVGGMCCTMGWKLTVVVWSTSIIITGLIALAVIMILS